MTTSAANLTSPAMIATLAARAAYAPAEFHLRLAQALTALPNYATAEVSAFARALDDEAAAYLVFHFPGLFDLYTPLEHVARERHVEITEATKHNRWRWNLDV